MSISEKVVPPSASDCHCRAESMDAKTALNYAYLQVFHAACESKASHFWRAAHGNGGCEASTPAVLQMSGAWSYQVYVT